MIQPTDVLRSYLQGIRKLSGVGSVTIYVPAVTSGSASVVLMHEGPLPPLPELADPESADELLRSLQDPAGGPSDPLHAELFPSRLQNGWLIRLPTLERLVGLGNGSPAAAPRPRRRRNDEHPGSPIPWVGICFESGHDPFPDGPGPLVLPPRPPIPPIGNEWWVWLLALGGTLAWHLRQISEILCDPVTGLPGRFELQGRLAPALQTARTTSTPLSLLLVHPDGFATVNDRFGREAGDRVILDVAGRLRKTLRGNDLLAKYGGAIFGAILSGADAAGAGTVAEKVLEQLTDGAYLDGSLGLAFSAGVATFDPRDGDVDHHLDLLRRADLALTLAKRAGGRRIIAWGPGLESEEEDGTAELSGVFTGSPVKDYRNMMLLSETIAVVAASADREELAGRVVERLTNTLSAGRVGLFELPAQGATRLVKGYSRHGGDAGADETAELVFPRHAISMVRESRRENRVLTHSFVDADTGTPYSAYCVPLVVGGSCVGAIYLDGRADSLSLDSSDRTFLRALAAQVAVALDRARLNEQETVRQHQEQERLRAEVDQLREALQQAKLEYRSQQMEALLSTVRRVAPTDATVLITGESGTGKELIASTIHRLSPRSKKAMIVVDCGAIPTTLIESELFGHEKGAYTGADRRKAGRLKEANEGTVFLDEIGELPLEVQTRLLRFVQERQLTPLGASRAEAVDVRVIAATNRDLHAEVQAGRFREDLYYRLNVVRLELPPLRERPDDVMHLAHHYLETYSLLYHKQVERLTPEAEALLLRQPWPGNVRELQNKIQQAVILCEGRELGPGELGLSEGELVGESREPARLDGPRSGPGADRGPAPISAGQLWERLRLSLARQIESTLGSGRPPVPLGRWLGDDLILAADLARDGVASRAAATVGIPETTFRRRRSKAAADLEGGLAPRPASWDEVRQILARLVRCRDHDEGTDLLQETQRILLEEVLDRVPKDVKTGSRLLGVTAPTFRRRSALLAPRS